MERFQVTTTTDTGMVQTEGVRADSPLDAATAVYGTSVSLAVTVSGAGFLPVQVYASGSTVIVVRLVD